MAHQVLMPKQGNTVESCIIVEWNVKVGDRIEVGTVLCSAETDKSTIDVESTVAGTVLALLYNEGDDVPVMLPIAVVGEPGEEIDAPAVETKAASPEASEEPSVTVHEAQAPQAASQGGAAEGSSPRARHSAQERGISLSAVAATGPKGRIIERDVLAIGGQPLSPAAREAALQGRLTAPASGSGIGGRVLERDLVASAAAPVSTPSTYTDIPLKGIRKITAERMMASIATTCQFTMSAWADARALKRLRAAFKAARPELGLGGITIGDLVLYAVSKTLLEFPSHNAHFMGDAIRQFASVDLGIATDTSKGLLVPVLRNSSHMSLKELSDAAKSLITKARDGKATPDELAGSTFTVSNVGAFGIEAFTPVLNIPEVAILGVGAIALKPVEDEDGDVVFIEEISLSLTADHQAVDGAEAARFLRALTENIKSIDLLLAL